MTDVISIISNVGFPITACIFLAFYCKTMIDDNRKQINEIQLSHKEEMTELRKAIENNTLIVQKLIDKMGSD